MKEILGHYHTYIESAIRDAHMQGLIHAPDPAAKARMLFAYSEGLLTQARIVNDVEVLREPDPAGRVVVEVGKLIIASAGDRAR